MAKMGLSLQSLPSTINPTKANPCKHQKSIFCVPPLQTQVMAPEGTYIVDLYIVYSLCTHLV